VLGRHDRAKEASGACGKPDKIFRSMTRLLINAGLRNCLQNKIKNKRVKVIRKFSNQERERDREIKFV